MTDENFVEKFTAKLLDVIEVEFKLPLGLAEVKTSPTKVAKEWRENQKKRAALAAAIRRAEGAFIAANPGDKIAQILHTFPLHSDEDYQKVIGGLLTHLSEDRITWLAEIKLERVGDQSASEAEIRQALELYLPFLRHEFNSIPEFREVIGALTLERIDERTRRTDEGVQRIETKLNQVIEKQSGKVSPIEPPGWHLKHRYALTGNFTGREAEQETLTAWLEEKEEPLFILRALGRFGKSALTWHWLLNKVDRTKWTKAIWWSFYEGDASFQNFLADTLKYLLGEDVELPSAPRLQVEMLLKALEKDDILLVMDGFERALRAYSGMNAAYQEDIEDESPLPSGEGQGEGEKDARRRDCISPAADDFLRGLASSKGILQAKVLLTTRLRPRAVEGRGGLLNGCLEKELKRLAKADAVAFFQNQGVKGTCAEIEATCRPYGYHPLTLSILAGYILGNRQKPNDISVAKELNITEDIIQNKHHVLEVAYNSLSPEEANLLSTIACFRSPTSYEALKSITESPLR